MIDSLLDNDFSRFLFQQVAYEKFPELEARYRFFRRDHDETEWTSAMIGALKDAVDNLRALRLSGDEIAFLEVQGCFSPGFLSYLRDYSAKDALVSVDDKSGLCVEIAGPLPVVALLTTPVNAICSEISSIEHSLNEARCRLDQKIAWLQGVDGIEEFRFNELGTRRRISRRWQFEINERLLELPHYTGTGNVWIASQIGTPLTGLMHHDFMQVFQVVGEGVVGSERRALEAWSETYADRFKVALSDTLGLDSFLNCFDASFAQKWAGVRHDSGDPIAWAHQMIAHYASLGLQSRDRTFVFADGLRFDTAVKIYRQLHGHARLSFGIGTDLTNDGGLPAPDTAIKLISCGGRPVVKASDDPSKNYGRPVAAQERRKY